MNEKIHELALQAGGSHYPTVGGNTLELFAKLVVRECLNMIENEAAQYAEPVWAVELVNDIKEQFGVEQ